MAEHLACAPFATAAEFLAAGCSCDLDAGDTALIEALLWDATDIVVQLIQGAYRGVCEVSQRPCRPSCSCVGHCCCTIDRIPLFGPDPRDFTVTIDGAVVDPATYAVMWFAGLPYLVRQRATYDLTLPISWPYWQDLTLPITQERTFGLEYTFGTAPTPLERDPVIEIACEMAKSYAENRAARLPAGTESASFQGLSVSIDPEAAPDESFPATARLRGFYMPGDRPPGFVWSPDLDEGWSFPVG